MSEDKNAVQKLIDLKHNEIDRLKKCIAHLEKIQWLKGIEQVVIYASTWSDDPPSMSLWPKVQEDAGKLAGQARRALGVKQTERSLCRSTGMVQFDGKSKDLTLKIRAKPVACKVRRVVTEVAVPEHIEPAHTEEKVTYVIENPEECGAAAGVEEEE